MDHAVELLPGVHHVALKRLGDSRGHFVKTHAVSALARLGIGFDLREEFHSVSARNVIRGMHFQRPPHDHDKLVYCASGRALDVLLDLRPGPGYGAVRSVVLDAVTPSLLVISRGVAHGFKALEDNTLLVYKTSSEHAPSHDTGIHWNSFGFDWQCDTPILSPRDQALPAFAAFGPTPFER